MSAFSGTVAALLADKQINGALLFSCTFTNGQEMRLWTGMGDITIGGQLYKGSGRLVSVENIDAAIGTSVPNTTFTLSGVDAHIVALTISEIDLVRGAVIQVSVQIFSSVWQPIDTPVGLGSWIGDQLSFERQQTGRNITLSAVSFFASRSRPQSSYYTARDQQLRYTGDRGGEFVAGLINKNINWPMGNFL